MDLTKHCDNTIVTSTWVNPQGTKLWIIMEYLGGGSALDLVSIFVVLFITLPEFTTLGAAQDFI